jgi:indole-3-glycerol phosphate synthase
MSLLDQILAQKRDEIRELRKKSLPSPPALRPLDVSRRADRFHLICEFKRKSPSAGLLSEALTLEKRLAVYETGGASMVSILCDGQFFGGGYDDLKRARDAVDIPLLAKEFILDESQLDHARAFGASAALLIVRCLTPAELARLHAAGLERELVPIVEVTTPEEAELAVDVGATHIGVNARNLDTLAMDRARAEGVLARLPSSKIRLHFSGVRDRDQVSSLRASGLDGALIGESLMRLDDPTELLRSFAAAAHSALP